MATDWIEKRSVPGRDLDWHPVEADVGVVRTARGPRFAVQVGDRLGIFVPDNDLIFAESAAEFVELRGTLSEEQQ